MPRRTHICLIMAVCTQYGLSTECTHWFCSECLRMSLETILEEGKFPAFCPSCYSEALEQNQKPAAGRIEDSTLTFLERSGVISKELQFRFMNQQARSTEGPLFFRCPAKCGNYLEQKKVSPIPVILHPYLNLIIDQTRDRRQTQ